MACKRRAGPSKSQCQPSDALDKGQMHFFKIILHSVIQEKKLMIPTKFARKYGDELSAVATLSVANGRDWRVGLMKAENGIYFHDGWHEFVEYYSICHGHFLVFSYKGISNFHVLIFDMTACEINYAFNGSSSEQGPNNDKQYPEERVFNKSSKKRFMNKRYNPSSKHYCCQSSASMDSSKNGNNYETRSKKFKMEDQVEIIDLDNVNESSQGKPLEHELSAKSEDDAEVIVSRNISRYMKTSQEIREKAIHAANLFKPKNPSFMVVLRPYSFSGSTLCVPFAFARKYLSRDTEYLTLQDSDGREWHVRIKFRLAGLYLKKGWYEFCRANNLEEGDVCVFELIKTNYVMLKVSIFHVSTE